MTRSQFAKVISGRERTKFRRILIYAVAWLVGPEGGAQ